MTQLRARSAPFAGVKRLACEMRANPYFLWAFGLSGEKIGRRLLWVGLIILLGFGLGTQLPLLPAIGKHWGTGRLLMLYLVLRQGLMLRSSTSGRAAAAEVSNGNFIHLYLSRLTPRDLILGWSLMALRKNLAETLILFGLIYPWVASAYFHGSAGGLSLVLPWAELVQVLGLQWLAALVSANTVLKFYLRREAMHAGWMASGFLYPLVLFMRGVLIVALLFFASVAVVLILKPPEWQLDQPAFMLREIAGILRSFFHDAQFWLLFGIGLSYFLGIPLGLVGEIERQLAMADNYSGEMRLYFEGK